VDLNEGVVDSDDLDTTVGDAGRDVRMLFGQWMSHEGRGY
jgi:hypothetical protein